LPSHSLSLASPSFTTWQATGEGSVGYQAAFFPGMVPASTRTNRNMAIVKTIPSIYPLALSRKGYSAINCEEKPQNIWREAK